MVKRNFYKSYKIYEAAGDEKGLRPIMDQVYFKDGYAHATDAHIAVRAKMGDISDFSIEEIKLLDGKMIHKNLLKRVYAHKNVFIKPDGFHANDGYGEIVYLFETKDLGKYPNVYGAISENNTSWRLDKVGINVGYLQRLANAMGCKTAKLEFTGKIGTKILVKDTEFIDVDITGIIMPVVVD